MGGGESSITTMHLGTPPPPLHRSRTWAYHMTGLRNRAACTLTKHEFVCDVVLAEELISDRASRCSETSDGTQEVSDCTTA